MHLIQLYKNYTLRSYLGASFSLLLNVAFLVYNLYLGLSLNSAYNTAITGYYFMLIILRDIIFICEKRWRRKDSTERQDKRQKLYRRVCWLLLPLNLAAIAPVVLMFKFQREVNTSMIPAITIAAYTFWKISIAIYNFLKTKKSKDLSLHSLKNINLMDALISILTLQNTMIEVFGKSDSMITVSRYSSIGILLLMIGLSIYLIRDSYKNKALEP